MTAATTNPPISLDAVLAYRHPGVLRRYAREHHASPQEAEEVFREMLKYLYLCYRAAIRGPEPFACVVSPEIEKIDWMWHTFLLFTLDYADFCESHFGFFLHHVPGEAEDETPVDEDALRAAVRRQFALVYDVLGGETLMAWYDRCRYAAPARPQRKWRRS
jgi:hypothetical protein